jgi:hypothetical protein
MRHSNPPACFIKSAASSRDGIAGAVFTPQSNADDPIISVCARLVVPQGNI